MRVKLSLLGLYQADNTIFDLMVTPPEIEKSTLINYLLECTADMSIVYTSPLYLKQSIALWSQRNISVWTHLVNTTLYDYNPINNYDRTETRNWKDQNVEQEGESALLNTYDDISKTETGPVTTKEKGTSATKGTTNDEQQTKTKTENSRAAYNSDIYEPTDSTDQTGLTMYDSTVNGEGTTTAEKTETKDLKETSTNTGSTNTTRTRKKEDTVNHSETIRAVGNIGVTTTQQMISQEREIALFNIYDFIASDFKKYFCLLVY